MRPSLDDTFIEICSTIAKRGTCLRGKVGAVIVKKGRIISMGYNGAPPGLQHCLSVGCNIVKGNCVRVTHAEQNAIAFAARTGVATEHATLYTTYAPCRSCSHSLIAAGIAAVVYVKDYHDDGLDILHDAAITVNRYKYSQAKLG